MRPGAGEAAVPGLLAGSAGSGDACGRDVGGGLARPRSRRGQGRQREGVRPHTARPAPGAGAMGGAAGDVQAGAGAVPSLGNATAGRLQGARGRRGVLSETPGFLNEERVDEKPETTKERSGSRARWEEIGPSHTKSEWPECRYEKAEDRREGLRFSQRGPGSGGRRRAAGTGGAGRGAAERVQAGASRARQAEHASAPGRGPTRRRFRRRRIASVCVSHDVTKGRKQRWEARGGAGRPRPRGRPPPRRTARFSQTQSGRTGTETCLNHTRHGEGETLPGYRKGPTIRGRGGALPSGHQDERPSAGDKRGHVGAVIIDAARCAAGGPRAGLTPTPRHWLWTLVTFTPWPSWCRGLGARPGGAPEAT